MIRPSILLLLAFSTCFTGCGIYSFNGADTEGAETIAIHFFENKAPIVVPELSQVFTQAMRDKFRNESPLVVTTDKGDWDISGTIVKYQTSFLAVQNDQPAKNRLSMGVRLAFVNTINEDKSFERTFEQFVDFDSDDELSSIEDELIEELSEKIVVDVYNATVNNW